MKHLKTFGQLNEGNDSNPKVAKYLSPQYNARDDQKKLNSIDDIKKFLELTKEDSHHYWITPPEKGISYQSYNGVLYANNGFLFDRESDPDGPTVITDYVMGQKLSGKYLIQDWGYKELEELTEGPNADMFNKIKELVKNTRTTTLSDDQEGDDYVSFATRENGNVGSETPGEEDIKDAYDMAKLIKDKFPNVETEVEEVDEWVHLTVTAK